VDPALVAGLVDVVGRANLVTDPEVTASYALDWTGRFSGSTPAVVRPASTDEVAAVVSLCRRHGAPIVPQGGNTGMVGGGVPLHGEIVVSLRRLTAAGPVDDGAPADRQLDAAHGTSNP